MRYISLSAGFLIGSLLQGFIVYTGERMGFSQFAIQFTVFRLIHHILVGQASGYVLFWLINRMSKLRRIAVLLSGISFGVLTWLILILAGTHTGLIQPEWLQFGGVITTLFAFMIYGLIAGLTIWKWGKLHGTVERNPNN